MISPGLGEASAERIAEVYRGAELRILAIIVQALAQGLDVPDWELRQLGRLQIVREQVVALLAVVNPEAAAALLEEIALAYGEGAASAYADVGQNRDALDRQPAAQTAAVRALVVDTVERLADSQSAILRRVDDVFRAVVAEASSSVLAGAETRRDATQRIINQLLGQGLPSVETARGRLSVADYANMAVRTATSRAAIAGQEAGMDELGLDLCIIQPGPRVCKTCDPWTRIVLARRGPAGLITANNEARSGTIQIRVDGTLSEARAAGCFHPNCRCSIAAFLPGVTKREELKRPPWDQAAYEAGQQQREIERQIRAWKVREAIAITDRDRAEAAAKVKGWQGAQRAHLASNPGLRRRSDREQIGGTFAGNPAAAR